MKRHPSPAASRLTLVLAILLGLALSGHAQEVLEAPRIHGNTKYRELAPEDDWRMKALETQLKAAPLTCNFVETFQTLNLWELEPGTLWHLQEDSACATAAPGYSSPNRALVFNLEGSCSYDTGARVAGYARMAFPVTIPQNVLAAVLSFQTSLELERGFDTAYVEVSKDGGATWEATSFQRRVSNTTWHEELVDLTAYIGQSVLVQFRFDSFDQQDNDYAGWYIDDVRICTTTVPPGFSGIYINDISVTEGDVGVQLATFTVTVEPPNPEPFGLRYRTVDDTAQAGDRDYRETVGTLAFAAGETEKTIEVPVFGDPFQEPDEVFLVELTERIGGGDKIVFANTIGSCTILNDDLPTTLFLDEFANLDLWTTTPGGAWIHQEEAPCLEPVEERPADLAAYTVPGVLNTTGGPFLTEEFFNDFNLTGRSVTFTPSATPIPEFYETCIDAVAGFHTDPAGGIAVPLADNGFQTVTLPANQVHLYGTSYSTFHIGSNGYITFTAGDSSPVRTLEHHFDQPRISGMLADLNRTFQLFPGFSINLSSVSYRILDNAGADSRVAVSYLNMSEATTAWFGHTFQIEMFFDGRIRITWLQTLTGSTIVGLSEGLGIPPGFTKTIFVNQPSCQGQAGPPPAVPCAYPPDRLDYLTLADTLSLPPATNIFLSWRDYAVIERINDSFFVEISKDLGQNWELLYESRESDAQWNTEMVNISAYSGHEVLIRFGFESDSSNEAMGWLIDWVKIDAVTLPAAYSIVYISDGQSPEGDGPDGEISLAEARVLVPAILASDFAVLDADSSGGLSQAELQAATAEANPLDQEIKVLAGALLAEFSAVDVGEAAVEFQLSVIPPNSEPITLRATASAFAPVTDYTALPGEDFPPFSGLITIPANQSSYPVRVPIIGDVKTEGDEAFLMTIHDSSVNAVISVGEAVGTIVNDDPVSGITINDIEINEGDDSTSTARFRITVAPTNDLPISFNFRTVEGTALETIDYLRTSGRINVEPGLDRVFVIITVRGDRFVEPDEDFFVELSNVSIAGQFIDKTGQPASTIRGRAVIKNDDSPEMPWSDDLASTSGNWDLKGDWHYIDNTDCIVPPAHSGTRALAYNSETTCTYDLAGGAADLLLNLSIPAMALQPTLRFYEYVQHAGDVVFEVYAAQNNFAKLTKLYTAPGDEPGWREVALDLSAFAGQTFNLRLQVNDTGTGGPPAGVGWYLDSFEFFYVDAANFRSLAIEPATVPEGNFGIANMSFKVQLSSAAAATSTINFHTEPLTATEGEDYLPVSGTLTFEPGDSTAEVTVPVKGDFLIEPDETFRVVLSNPSDNLFVQANSAIGTIRNDDYAIGTIFGLTGDTTTAKFVETNMGKPQEVLEIASHSGLDLAGGDFSGYDFTTFYGLDDAQSRILAFDTTLGTSRPSFALSKDASHGTWRGLAWDLQRNRFFALASPGSFGALYRLDRQLTQLTQGINFFGMDSTTWVVPFYGPLPSIRLMSVYPASVMGSSRQITGMSLYITSPSGGSYPNFTVRMRAVPFAHLDAQSEWPDEAGWQLVYQREEVVDRVGWFDLQFDTPFQYVQGEHLALDMITCNTVLSNNYAVAQYAITQQNTSALGTANVNMCGNTWTAAANGFGRQIVRPWVRFDSIVSLHTGNLLTGGGGQLTVDPVALAVHPATSDFYVIGKGATAGATVYALGASDRRVKASSALNLGGNTGFTLEDVELDFDDQSGDLYIAATSNRSGAVKSELFRLPSSNLNQVAMLVGQIGAGAPMRAMGITALPSPPGFGATFMVGQTLPGIKIEGFATAGSVNPLVEEWITGTGVGDVNGDGFEDFFVSTPGVSVGANDKAGRSYLIFGGNPALDATGRLQLSAFNATHGVQFPGLAADTASGFSVSGLGDINGDGIEDFAIAAPFGGGPGVVYLIYGKPNWNPTFNLGSGISDDVVVLHGAANGEHTGFSVAGGGDINGDGLNDVLIGAPNAFGWFHTRGATYVLFGSPSKPGGLTGNFDLASLDGSTGIILYGAEDYWTAFSNSLNDFSKSGAVVSGAGDFNGDGYADFIVGDYAVHNNNNRGNVYLVYGAKDLSGISGERISTLPASACTIFSAVNANNQYFGWSAAPAGDVNGDGFSDLILSAYNSQSSAGRSLLVYGRRTMPSRVIDVTASTIAATSFSGPAGSLSGYSVSSAGDFNGDGYADLLIGAPGADPFDAANAGEVYVVFGSPSLQTNPGFTINLASLGPEACLRIQGGLAGDAAGRQVSHVGDVNGDGLSDILITAPGASPEAVAQAGEAYIVYGQAASNVTTARYKNFMRSGVGDPPVANLPPEQFVVPTLPVGYVGDGSHEIPLSRVSMGFKGGGTGTQLKSFSSQEVTRYQQKAPVGRPDFVSASVHWKLVSDRLNFSESYLKFYYTEADVAGLLQEKLDLFYTPDDPPTPGTEWLTLNTVHDLKERSFRIDRTHTAGQNFMGHYAIMQLDLKFELGTEIPIPVNIDVNDIPPFGPELIPANGAFWHNKNRKLYATRPGAIEVKWNDQVSTVGVNVWPEKLDDFQVHIAQTPPVSLESGGTFPYAELMYTEPGTGVASEVLLGSQTLFATGPGRSLVMLADGATSQGANIFFLRVLHAAWDDALFLFDEVPAVIGQEIVPGFDHDPNAGGPFLFFSRARVNQQGNYYNRETRTGPIIPVNLDTPSIAGDDLVIVYYTRGVKLLNPVSGNYLNTVDYWPVQPVRYNASWPATTKKVVIAKDHPDTALNPNKFGNPGVYVQNDPLGPGFNPNEEHAFVAGGRLYALRDDMNLPHISEPYVLVTYADATDANKPKVEVFQVAREDAALGLTFEYNAVAGLTINAPVPLQILNPAGLCGEDVYSDISVYEPSNAANPGDPNSLAFRDRSGALWAMRAAHNGGTETGQMFYYYPSQPSFYYPDAFFPDGTPGPGECVAWLDFADSTTDTPIAATYTFQWPDDINVPTLYLGQTLAKPIAGAKGLWHAPEGYHDGQFVLSSAKDMKQGAAQLPDISLACSVSVLYDQADSNGLGQSVELFDYAAPRRVPLLELPADVTGKLSGTHTNLIDLPPHLIGRLRYFHNDEELEFRGEYIEIPTGDDVLLPNIMTEIDYHFLRGFSEIQDWKEAIDELWNNHNNRIVVTDSGPPPYAFALTSSLNSRGGYVTIAVDNNPDLCNGLVQLQVIRVDCPRYVSSIVPIFPSCVFDQQLTMRYVADFAGTADEYLFEWIYLPDDGKDPRTVPISQWLSFPMPAHPVPGKEPSRGAVQVTIQGPNPITLSDNFFRVRYRYAPQAKGTAPTGPCDDLSDWTEPQLAPGWIKRVVGEINPFTQRASGGFIAGAERKFFEYHEDEVSTVVSMLQQAGPRFEGAVALNCDNLNELKLIPTYETVLQVGSNLSINAPDPYDFPPASNALLLVASRIADLYTMLGNEAYGDAADPTIGFGTTDGNDFAQVATSLHCFMNQTASLLEEELILMRGRDNSALPGTGQAPVYNRFYPNFSTDFTGGQVAYVLNYGITDVTGNGTADVNDALLLYPQGHGDAWGHYLTATKAYYRLFAHPVYQYRPRAETILIGAQPVSVDFFDERKFASAAAAKARTGAEIVGLTYRSYYTENPDGQYQGYFDNDPQRAWGVSEWAARAGQAAYFDWVVGNALLPQPDPNVPLTIQKIDRSTVLELREIASSYQDIQGQLDKANVGLNPLGLAKNVVPFDIDPNRIDAGETHFEQVFDRSVKAMVNAITVFNHANQSTQRLRLQQDTVQDFQRNVVNQETDFKGRLIEIFGYPHAGNIGPGKPYPPGYDGPDIYFFDYFEPRDLLGVNFRPGEIQQVTLTMPEISTTLTDLGSVTGNQVLVTHHISEKYGTVVPNPSAWGQRRAPGEIQLARQDLFQAITRYNQALDNYDAFLSGIRDKVALLEAQYGIQTNEIQVQNTQLQREVDLNTYLLNTAKTQFRYRLAAKVTTRAANAISEGIPKFIVAGLAVGFDATSVARGIIKGIAAITEETLNGLADKLEVDKLEEQNAKAEMTARENLQLATAQAGFAIQQALSELRNDLLNETTLRYEIYNLQVAMHQSMGRYKSSVASGQRELDKLLVFRRQTAAQVEQLRYRDMAFRIFRNDALQKYRAQFDLAARYVFLAAQAYDYETNLLRTDTRSGQQFMNEIVKSRSLGLIQDGIPVTAGLNGDPGLADPMARMIQNWEQVLKAQLGFNNPQTETNRFSLRTELFRISPGTVGRNVWRQTLEQHVVPNVLDLPEFRRYCRVFDNALPQEPAIVIPFSSTVTFGQNFFGWPLGGGDSSYDSTQFVTKVRSVGVWFSNYNNLGSGMSNTPRVYLIPVGSDVMRSPTEGINELRHWKIIDQKLPTPFTLGATDFLAANYIPSINSLTDQYAGINKYSMFRAYHDSGNFDVSEVVTASRLIGRSVANTEWMLIIPAGALSANRNEAIERFINGRLLPNGERDGNGVSDIKLFFQTYAISGN